ncbi:MAG: tRNA uridine(34) 5-carboxymethylaminomethyl modification radical SAM/GNAT enzyme Elp3 [Anaerolineae bacterium]|nr:tRNA uridine(34) 5-carboxymethylaminomethyl modification radical SAM/GNAT enzyme Elp3 [Anaerolineae bacterium]NUQ03527.1 tRNA uridine(34) 5-carboxymethylaminomethyl modification radical SAM/GNAT enzyme Elp3 [Anaerolineae bacterium]
MSHKTALDLDAHRDHLLAILRQVIADERIRGAEVNQVVRAHARRTGAKLYTRDELIRAYRQFAGNFDLPAFDPGLIERLRLKPVRTSSGVTPVTILTKPFPCPGECIFCPNDIRMPKSYLSDEPGAQRAEQNSFDPYLQTMSRLHAYYQTGHPTDKVELIILGGTWSFYPETYQVWFVRRAFDALHDFGAGIDHSTEVERLLLEGSQLHPERNTTAVTLHGDALQQTYNQVVQAIYKDEMRRSRELSDALRMGQFARSPIDEYATWAELEAAHRINEGSPVRCVGLVIETRPDHISEEEVLRIRRLGCTKVQIGIQSLNDEVLRLNRRGHTVAATRRAVHLLRAAGFKIHAHWMPNLYGSSPQQDIEDYARLFEDPDFRPDELKLYPCSLIESAELMGEYRRGNWQPYSHDELLETLIGCLRLTPEYCRLTRIVRDIPSTDIVAGNKLTNFRQIAEEALARQGERSRDIRAREIRQQQVVLEDLHLDEVRYSVSTGEEIFLQMITDQREIAGFLRLSLPAPAVAPISEELRGAAVIREVHVYGQAVEIGETGVGRAQHSGLGTRLIERAVEISRAAGYDALAVISAVGTREYYRKRGFSDGSLYQRRSLREAVL